ncbi:Fc receptor-like protein 5 [Pelodiscus sinensis]|uniref:Fc receptor-like protein 5 n=1 Tax=Pelodiscus sinensis TaxID=13735 RepID=UPI003F6CD68F
MELTHLLPALACLQLLPWLVSPTAPNPAPAFSIDPQKDEYLLGDTVALTCSAPHLRDPVTQFQYYSNMGSAVTSTVSSGWKETYNLNITDLQCAGEYICVYYTGKTYPFNKSRESNRITIKVKDPPPQPTLSVNPPPREVNEGHRLVITCTAPGDASERRFHFYQHGAEIIPGDAGSATHITAPGTVPRNVAVLSIPRADTNSSGEYSCGYEEKDSGRWIPSTRSQAVMVTLKERPVASSLSRELAVGGAFFTLNGLIFLTTYFLMKCQDSRRTTTQTLYRAKPEGEPQIYSTIDPSVLPSPSELSTPPASVSPADQQYI